jgi:proteasome lid subunit RPN8/RPN11
MQTVEKIDYRDSDRLSTSLALGDCPSGSVSLRCAYSLLEQIRKEVVDKFLSIPRGGLEIGGVLFGTITGEEIQLLAHKPLDIEYLNGPSFVLSRTDEINLIQLIGASQSDPELQGMEPVGWYHSHTRSDLSLTDEDIAVHQRFFPRPEHVALVIRPHKFEPAQAGFFVRNTDGSLQGDAPRASFAFPLPGADESKNGDTPAPSVAVTSPDVHKPAVHSPFGSSPIHSDEVDSDAAAPVDSDQGTPNATRRNWGIGGLAAAVLCVAVVMFLPNQAPTRQEPAPMWVHVSDAGNQLTITWNRSSPTVANARTAEILITDGDQQTARVPLDKESLSRGTISYVRHSGNVEVRMRVQSQADRFLEEVVRFIGPEIAPPPAPIVPVKRDEPDPEVLRMKAEMERLKKELVRAQPDGTRTRSVPVQQAIRATDTSRGRFPAPVKPSSPVPGAPNISDIRPPVLTSQTQLSSPVLPVPAWQPAIAKPPAPPGQQRTVSRKPASGRAIWTGRLPKGGLLLFDGLRPSVGTLNGPLPQKAAHFRVYAADLGDSGIVVFSGATRRDAVEPPSAANGWNLTSYNADPKRARSVSVLEYPGQQNGWKRLLVRSEDRTLSMLVIDWTEMPAETER